MYGRVEQSRERCGRGKEGRGQGTGRDGTIRVDMKRKKSVQKVIERRVW